MKKIIAILLLLFGLHPNVIYAQQQLPDSVGTAATSHTERDSTWMLWGTLGSGQIGPGIGGVLKLTYAWESSSVSLKAAGGGTINIFGSSKNNIEEYNVSFGKQLIYPNALLRIAAGPSYYVRSIGQQSFNRIGLGIEGEAMLKYKFVGLGVMVLLMNAPDISFSGVTINLSIGKLE